MTHAFAREGRKKSSARDPLDRYETPEYVTRALLARVSFEGPILEPAAGTGRMANVLRRGGYKVETSDITRGRDFLKRTAPCVNIVTNPPYGGTLPELFVRKALSLATGKVAMLLKHGFLWSGGRSSWLGGAAFPEMIIIMSNRIVFESPNGKPIKSQFFDHAWIVWRIGKPYPHPITIDFAADRP